MTARSRNPHPSGRGGGQWTKTAQPGNTLGHAELSNEHTILTALGADTQWDGTTLRTPDFGNPIRDVWPGDIPHLIQLARQVNTIHTPTAPSMADIVTQAIGKVDVRNLTGPIRGVCLTTLGDLAKDPPARGGIVHTDAHTDNWARPRNGLPLLIDWETGASGPVDITLASLWVSVGLLDGNARARTIIEAAISDPDVFEWGCRLKAVTGLSWLWWRRGEDAARHRTLILARNGLL